MDKLIVQTDFFSHTEKKLTKVRSNLKVLKLTLFTALENCPSVIPRVDLFPKRELN